MAPGDDTGAGIIIIGFFDDIGDLGIAHSRDLVNEWIRQAFAHFSSHFSSTLRNGLQNLLTI